ncbi:hypothetical protein LCGC14_2561050, partial [marine sediment metagenome]
VKESKLVISFGVATVIKLLGT